MDWALREMFMKKSINMMKNNFWNNTFIYGIGFLLLRGISFFLLPVYTNLLSEFEAGTIFLIYTLLAFLNPVYAYGMNASLFKFYVCDFFVCFLNIHFFRYSFKVLK